MSTWKETASEFRTSELLKKMFTVYLKPLSNMIQKLTVERMAVVVTKSNVSNVFLMRIGIEHAL